jgi:hypothetical protein
MKKFTFLVLAGMVLALMGMTACTSFSKLDISTLDPSQPVQVTAITLQVLAHQADGFYGKYGAGLKNSSDVLQNEDTKKLLTILCGTAAEKWEFITQRVKAQTGLTLDGDTLLEDWKNGSTNNIKSQELARGPLGAYVGYFYTWENMAAIGLNALIDGEYPPHAFIRLIFSSTDSTLSLHSVIIETQDMDELGEVDKASTLQAEISLR